MRLSAEILPIVRIFTLFTMMSLTVIIKGTPDCLEMEHVEIWVFFHFMKEINPKLFFRVGECTEVSKLTFYKTKELGYCSRVSVIFRLKTSIVTTVTS